MHLLFEPFFVITLAAAFARHVFRSTVFDLKSAVDNLLDVALEAERQCFRVVTVNDISFSIH